MVRLQYNQKKLLLMVLTVFVSIFPVLLMAPTWLIFACMFCLCFRSLQSLLNSPPTHWLLKLILTVVGFTLLVLEVKGRLDYLFFIYFLVLFVSFKVLEIQNRRDYLTQVLVNLYVLFASLILVMELWIFAYILIAGIFNFIVLFKLHNPTVKLSMFRKRNLPLMMFTLVITIILFYVFPRISSPLWQLPSPGQKQTGFSDKLKLGDVHELVLDDSQAMKIVTRTNLGRNPYWRGLALTFYDGLSWQISKAARTPDQHIPKLNYDDEAEVEIILEPTKTPWVITTGQVDQAYPSLIHIPNVGIMQLSKQRITRQFGYRFNLTQQPSRMINSSIWHLNQQFPSYANPRLQKWARTQMRVSRNQTDVFIQRIKSEIQQKPFWYTLNPASIGRNAKQLDTFWFKTREGYCEYYASTVAFILRVAGIPARVIVGYQGGQWNPIGQYLVVKQSDAHAWVEYWHEDKGWIRLDPTTWIPTNRIDDSIQTRIQRLRQTNYGYNFDRYGHNLGFWQRARYYLESAHFFWQRWLLFYNYDTQQQLKDLLTSQELVSLIYQHIKWLWLIFLAIFLATLWRWWRNRPSPLQRQVTQLKQLFDKLGICYHAPETFTSMCQQLMEIFPQHRDKIKGLQMEYESLRYQTHQPTSKLSLVHFLKTIIKNIKQWSKEYQSK